MSAIEWSLPTRHLGRRVVVHDALDSTNSHALARGDDPANHGLAVLTRFQSAGRGQHGRTWTAPAESSVLLSILLFLPATLRRPALLTAWAAVSVAELILRLTGAEARIKWPNDVFVSDKKVCGILIEQRSGVSSSAPATVVGLGLNVAQPAAFFEAHGLPQAGSLVSQCGFSGSWEAVARGLIQQLDEEYDRLVQGDSQTLEARWRGRLGLLGGNVRADTGQAIHHGRLLEVGFDAVLLQQAGGDVLRLVPEAIRHLEAT